MDQDDNAAVLIVDDEDYIRRIVARILEGKGYRCEQARNANAALEALAAGDFKLMVTDIMMPGMSGVELLHAAREIHPDLAVIMLTAVDNHDTAVSSLGMGAYGYVIKPFQANELLINVANAMRRRELENLRDQYELKLESDVRKRTMEIRRTQEEVTLRLMMAAEYRDKETGDHIKRIGVYAALLAKKLGWNDQASDDLRLTAPMHDVGKIGVPDDILQKPAKLTSAEFEQIKQHTVIGANILNGSKVAILKTAKDIAFSHHERWDGLGYPLGLKGDEIPISARIVSVCDVYDSLVNNRVYRPAISEEKALDIMKEGRGKQFDEKIYDLFMNSLPEFQQIRKEHAD